MRIGFAGFVTEEKRGQVLSAVACMCVQMKRGEVFMTELSHGESISHIFAGELETDFRYRERNEYNMTGTGFLAQLNRLGGYDGHALQNASYELCNRKLYYLPRYDYSPDTGVMTLMIQLRSLLDKADTFASTELVDCGCDPSVFRHPGFDRMVVVIDQTPEVLEKCFLEYRWLLSKDQVFFLLADYDPYGAYNRKNIERIYGLDGNRILYLPVSPELESACRSGQVHKYISRGLRRIPSERNRNYFNALSLVADRLSVREVDAYER